MCVSFPSLETEEWRYKSRTVMLGNSPARLSASFNLRTTSLSINPIASSSSPRSFLKFLDEDFDRIGAGRSLTFGTLFDRFVRRVRAEKDILDE